MKKNPAENVLPLSPSRREFLWRAGTMTGGLLAMDLSGFFSNQPSAAVVRPYATTRYALELDGVAAGYIRSFEGGTARGEVLQTLRGSSPFPNKHLGPTRYDSVSLACELGMEKPFFDWIKATLSGIPQRKSGAIVSLDPNYKVVERLEFKEALITEVGFPALDGGSKNAAFITVKFEPVYTTRAAVPGGAIPQTMGMKKMLLLSNFSLKIQGLEQSCAQVNRIEALTIQRNTTVEVKVGEERVSQQRPGVIYFPNLVFTLAEASAGPFYAWRDDFVVNGHNTDDKERPGVLEMLSPDRTTVLSTLSFFNLGIVSAAPLPQGGGADAIRLAKVELYCEQIGFTLGPVGSPTTQANTTPSPAVKGTSSTPVAPPSRSTPATGVLRTLAPGVLPRQVPKW